MKSSGVIRKLSFVCGLASGALLTTKGLDYLESKAERLQRSSGGDLELRLVQVLFRHGARTPLKIVPGIEEITWEKDKLLKRLPHTDIDVRVQDVKNRVLPVEHLNNDILKGGCQKGELTVVGQAEAYNLGKTLRRLYIDQLKFIDGAFNPNTTYLRTTHVPRTIDSLRCLVAGMFQDIPNSLLFWTVPIDEEFLFPNWTTCSALRQYIKHCFRNAHTLQGYEEDMEKFFDMIGGSVHRLTFVDIMDDLAARRAHNKPFPEKMKRFMSTIEKRSVQLFKEAFLSPPSWTNDLVLPLAVGRLTSYLCENIKENMTGKNGYKFYLLSVHDTTLFTLLCALGVDTDAWPPFASNIALELYRDKNKQYFVQILYCGKVVKLNNCEETLIPLSQFERICSQYFVEDWSTSCQTTLHPPHGHTILI